MDAFVRTVLRQADGCDVSVTNHLTLSFLTAPFESSKTFFDVCPALYLESNYKFLEIFAFMLH